MAEGALKGSDAQVALSITGFAGPGAPGDEPGSFISPVRVRAARLPTAKSTSGISVAAAFALRPWRLRSNS
jgi:nicotinamide mononucleotide (NMN) deamidase PncC